jgi:hypothetical protein
MADKTQAELDQEASDNLKKENEAHAEEQKSAAEGARGSEADQAETEEEYNERIRLASATGIFGDTDTTAGAGAVGIDVPTASNEDATVAVAEKDASGKKASDDKARRTTSADAGAEPDSSETPDNPDPKSSK